MQIIKTGLCCLSLFLANTTRGQQSSGVYIARHGDRYQMMVDNKPFLMLGGEWGNSSASTISNMAPIWPKLKTMNLNTALVPVYWELMEPEEGKYDFSLIDDLLENARENNIKLVLLWFGSWKNSMSCYVPGWIKKNIAKYERAVTADGKKVEILSAFDDDNLNIDIKAFSALMAYIKAKDSKEHTVIMMQVENEIGMLGAAREHTPAANAAFAKPLPADLAAYLQKNKASLTPFLQKKLMGADLKGNKSWSAIFGADLAGEEVFQAWYYAKYAGAVAAAGKKVYDLPMYVNTALNYKNVQPGEYPSAGPLPHLMDIWKAAAPAIDVLSPDFYNPYFKSFNDQYTRADNPLFIPEIRFDATVVPKAFYAMGHYKSMGFSPFDIESTPAPENEPIRYAYDVLSQISTDYFNESYKMDGFLLDKKTPSQQVTMGNFIITVSHDNTLSWSPHAKDTSWEYAGGLIIQTGANEFMAAGVGMVITFKSTDASKIAGLLETDEGKFEKGKWVSLRRLSGDQTHQGRHVNIPLGPSGIQKFKLYTY